jgi:hypothetical protein
VLNFLTGERLAEVQFGTGRFDHAVHETADIGAIRLMVFFPQHGCSSRQTDGGEFVEADRSSGCRADRRHRIRCCPQGRHDLAEQCRTTVDQLLIGRGAELENDDPVDAELLDLAQP